MASRHRKKYISADYSDDDFEDSVAEEETFEQMSPDSKQYLYNRNRSTESNTYVGTTISHIPQDIILENDAVEDEEVFQMDDEKPISFRPPPGFEVNIPQKHVVLTLPVMPENLNPLPSTNSSPELFKPELPNISNLKVGEAGRSSSKSPSRKNKNKTKMIEQGGNLPSNSSSHRLNQLAEIASDMSTPRRTRKLPQGEKELINLVVVGHVDAGKSTLMGHLLVQMGAVDQRTMHKYKQESARTGKASFAFAWVLDETEEERARGVTMDIAKTFFETKRKRVLLLDAPGHKDFIPNMITGASQADAAILVVNATRGEFETGFENGGQTREHAMLLRSLGVAQLVVAINKLDTVDWSEDRFNEVQANISTFLTKQAGFSKIRYVPVSGLVGDNLSHKVPDGHLLNKWYKGGPLLEYIDSFTSPSRPIDGPLRIVINDVLKITTNMLSISGKIESGEIEAGDKVFIMPNAESATIKSCINDDGGSLNSCVAGDQALITLNGVFEPDTVNSGHVIVRGGEDTLIPGKRFLARLVVFDIAVPLMKGTKAELYCHSLCVPCTLVKLVASINKSNGEVIKERPRCISKNMSGIVEIETDADVAIEPFTNCRALGRLTIRAGGHTLAAGIIEKKLA